MILNWYYNLFFGGDLIGKPNLYIVYPAFITSKDIIDSYGIEQRVLPKNLISPIEVVKGWHKHNNKTMIGVRDENTDKIVGFINSLPVSEKLFDKIINGNYMRYSFANRRNSKV